MNLILLLQFSSRSLQSRGKIS